MAAGSGSRAHQCFEGTAMLPAHRERGASSAAPYAPYTLDVGHHFNRPEGANT